MKTFSILHATLLVAGFTGSVPTDFVKSNTILRSNHKPYKTIDMQWDIKVNNADRPYNLTINGTIQDVLEYISVANDPTTTARRDETMGAVRPSVDHSSQDRYKPTHHLCDIENWGRAGVAPLWDGIDYLEHVPGTPRHAPGPGECARVSCSFNSAIYWCNEKAKEKVLNSYEDIADAATLLVKKCRVKGISGNWEACGQQFYKDGWSVFVRRDEC